MKKLFKFLTSRIMLLAIVFIIQISLLVYLILSFQRNFVYVYTLNIIISFAFTIMVVNTDVNPSFKLGWLIPIWIFPLFGAVFYLFFRRNRFVRAQQRRMDTISSSFNNHILSNGNVIDELEGDSKSIATYINTTAHAPVFSKTSSKYLKNGEIFFEYLMEDLKNAKDYIFLEFFIIEEGYMFNNILEVLEQKVKEGVDVRILYDDFGCITKLSRRYYKKLEEKGIKVQVFNKIKVLPMPRHNNRDHRKIVVIDGKVAYTGGFNLADEYMNKIQKFGYWKDTGIRVTGDGVWSFTIMFLSIWELYDDNELDYKYYFEKTVPDVSENEGYCQPYTDSPLDDVPVGKGAYMQLVSRSRKYFYITTPYLIPSDDMIDSLRDAALSGVDVRIMTPGIPDKKLVYMVTRTYYKTLLEAGVRIFEYTPGFLHAKSCVSDDKHCVIGSINLDFRSLYLHFENGAMYYDSHIVDDLKEDFLEMQSQSQEIFSRQLENQSVFRKILSVILKVFSPMIWWKEIIWSIH